MSNIKTIASRLVELRKIKGISQEKLAEELNVSVSSISMYEIGARIPRDEVKVKLADYYGTTVEALFFAQ